MNVIISFLLDRNPHFLSLLLSRQDFSHQIVLDFLENQTICPHIPRIFQFFEDCELIMASEPFQLLGANGLCAFEWMMSINS
jgi:hypothetical protein